MGAVGEGGEVAALLARYVCQQLLRDRRLSMAARAKRLAQRRDLVAHLTDDLLGARGLLLDDLGDVGLDLLRTPCDLAELLLGLAAVAAQRGLDPAAVLPHRGLGLALAPARLALDTADLTLEARARPAGVRRRLAAGGGAPALGALQGPGQLGPVGLQLAL